jgi:hypothetical protein
MGNDLEITRTPIDYSSSWELKCFQHKAHMETRFPVTRHDWAC